MALANSRIAIELFERYADKIVIKEAPRITLKTFMVTLIEGNPAYDYHNNPFEDIGDNLVDALPSLG